MIFQFEQQEVDGYPQLIPRNYTLHDFKTITSRWQLGMQEKGGWNSIYIEVSRCTAGTVIAERIEPRRG